MFSQILTCRFCNSSQLVTIINLGYQPLSGVFPLPNDPDPASGPLELVNCLDCNFVQLNHSYHPTEMYGMNYGYKSSSNTSMVRHLQDTAEWLAKRSSLVEEDIVLDVGCNDGTFLNYFSQYGINCFGMDPSSEKYRANFDSRLKVISDFFSLENCPEEILGKVKLVTTIAMFYDVVDPLSFARNLNKVLKPGGFWFLEQSYATWMQKTSSYDTICHEHLFYYSMKNLLDICDQVGFEIVSVSTNNTNGGSLSILAMKSKKRSTDPYMKWLVQQEEKNLVSSMETWSSFALRVNDKRDSLNSLIDHLLRHGAVVNALGASTKGNIILNYCGLSQKQISTIGEVNSFKYGRMTPGSRIPIVDERLILDSNAKHLVLLPWHFRENAVNRYSDFLREGGKIILPLPEVEVIGT